MYNVLHVMPGADAGGISTVVLNYYKVIDRNKIHFDVAVTTDMIGQNAVEMQKLGVRIYKLPLKSKGIKAFEVAMADLLNKENYQAVHVHENETSYVALRIAKKAGIPQRIAHAHTSSPYVSIKSELRRLSGCALNYYYATNVVGCGWLAGERVFGKINMRRKKACVLPNAIDTNKFYFSERIRKKIRSELNVEKNYVIGMVGRLSEQKNYMKAVEIMEMYHKLNPKAVLLCVGNGELEQDIRNMIAKKQMNNYVRLLGRRSDVERLYSAFDVLLMPSKYEGFPVAAVEAISEGLPVLLSNTITGELKSCANVYYLPLADINAWMDKLTSIENLGKYDRSIGKVELKKCGLDIEIAAKQLEDIYLKFGEQHDSDK